MRIFSAIRNFFSPSIPPVGDEGIEFFPIDIYFPHDEHREWHDPTGDDFREV